MRKRALAVPSSLGHSQTKPVKRNSQAFKLVPDRPHGAQWGCSNVYKHFQGDLLRWNSKCRSSCFSKVPGTAITLFEYSSQLWMGLSVLNPLTIEVVKTNNNDRMLRFLNEPGWRSGTSKWCAPRIPSEGPETDEHFRSHRDLTFSCF